MLREVGYADALIARELEDGRLELIDGHLRAETTPDAIVPVLVLDVDEAEAAKLMATLDPLAAMAETNAQRLDVLLREIDTGSDDLRKMLADLASNAGLYAEAPPDFPEVDESIETEHKCPKCGYAWSGKPA